MRISRLRCAGTPCSDMSFAGLGCTGTSAICNGLGWSAKLSDSTYFWVIASHRLFLAGLDSSNGRHSDRETRLCYTRGF